VYLALVGIATMVDVGLMAMYRGHRVLFPVSRADTPDFPCPDAIRLWCAIALPAVVPVFAKIRCHAAEEHDCDDTGL
jgi:hypothetical protein